MLGRALKAKIFCLALKLKDLALSWKPMLCCKIHDFLQCLFVNFLQKTIKCYNGSYA